MMKRENVQIYLVSKDKKVLMLKRTEERSGYWQPVCGGIEAGEEAIEAAIREVAEETGINNYLSIRSLPFSFEYEERKNDIILKMKDTCFLMNLPTTQAIELSDEHVTYKWCDLNEVKALTDWQPIHTNIDYIRTIYKK